MRTIYAVQFDVESPQGAPAGEVAMLVRRMAVEWVSEWYARNATPAPDMSIEGGEWKGSAGHLLRVGAFTLATERNSGA